MSAYIRNDPYFVSAELLKDISDSKNEEEFVMGFFGDLCKSEFEKWVENASHQSLCFEGAVIVSEEIVEKYDREMDYNVCEKKKMSFHVKLWMIRAEGLGKKAIGVIILQNMGRNYSLKF